MKNPGLRTMTLQLRLALMRFGWSNGIAAFICAIGAASWLWGMPHLHAQIDARQNALSRARQSLQAADSPEAVVKRPKAEERLANFYENLGEKAYAEQQVKTLFASAEKSGLSLNQAEYKLAFDKNGGYYTYLINLPVKGSYGAIRQFCEQVLLAIPFASLDEISFKRDAISNRTLEAKLRFTLYLAAPASQQKIALDAKDGMP
jgi:Tfp pilus assembly protein PilO